MSRLRIGEILIELDRMHDKYLATKSLFELKILVVNNFSETKIDNENDISKCQKVCEEKLQSISQINVISSSGLSLYHEYFENLSSENIPSFEMELKDSLNSIKSFLCEYEIILNLIEFISNPNDDRKVRLYLNDQKSQEKIVTLSAHTKPIYCFQIFSDNKIITGSGDNSIKIWDIQKFQCICTLLGHRAPVSHLKMSDDYLISVSADKTIKIWNIYGGYCMRTLIGHQNIIFCIKLLGNDTLVTGSFDQTIKVWDMNTGKCF
jgi:WD40 repeat protein